MARIWCLTKHEINTTKTDVFVGWWPLKPGPKALSEFLKEHLEVEVSSYGIARVLDGERTLLYGYEYRLIVSHSEEL